MRKIILIISSLAILHLNGFSQSDQNKCLIKCVNKDSNSFKLYLNDYVIVHFKNKDTHYKYDISSKRIYKLYSVSEDSIYFQDQNIIKSAPKNAVLSVSRLDLPVIEKKSLHLNINILAWLGTISAALGFGIMASKFNYRIDNFEFLFITLLFILVGIFVALVGHTMTKPKNNLSKYAKTEIQLQKPYCKCEYYLYP